MFSQVKGDRFIFVGGSPRSGTTLVQNILDTHTEICGGPEFLHLPDIVGLRNNLYNLIDRGWITKFCSYNQVDRSICSLIENLLLPLADRQGCQFLSEKTPANVLIFSELMELFPQAMFIHIIRDPRAIIAPMIRVGIRNKEKGWKTQDFTTDVSAAISHVKKCFRAGFAVTASAHIGF